jgi:hypothetical protein
MANAVSGAGGAKPIAHTPLPIPAANLQGGKAVRPTKAKNGAGAGPIRNAVRKELDSKIRPKLERLLAGNPQALKRVRPLLQTVEKGIVDTVETLSRTAAAKVPLSDGALRQVEREMAMKVVAAIDRQGIAGLAAVAVEVAALQSPVTSPTHAPQAGYPKTYIGTDPLTEVSGTGGLVQLTLFDTGGIGVAARVPLAEAWARGQRASNAADRTQASWDEIGKVLFPIVSRPQVLLNVERKWLEGKIEKEGSGIRRNSLEVRATVPLLNLPFLDAGQGVRVTSSESRMLGSNRAADGIFAVARERPLLRLISTAVVGGVVTYGLSKVRAPPQVSEAVAMTAIGLTGAFTSESSTLYSWRATFGVTGDLRAGFKSEPNKSARFAQLQIEPAIDVQLLPVISSYNSFSLSNSPLDLATAPLYGKVSGKYELGLKTSDGFFNAPSGAAALGMKANVSAFPLSPNKSGPTQYSIDPFNGTTLDLNKPADKKRWSEMFGFLLPAAPVMAQRGSNRKAEAATLVMTVGRTYLNFGKEGKFYRATVPYGSRGDAFAGKAYGVPLDSGKVAALEARTQNRPLYEQLFDMAPGFVQVMIDNRSPGQRAISRQVERAGVEQQLKPAEAVAAELNSMAVQHPDRFGQASYVTAERLIAANKHRLTWVNIPQSDGSTRSVAAFREGENIDTTLVASRRGGVMLATRIASESVPMDLPAGRQRSTHVQKVPQISGASSSSPQQRAPDPAQTRQPGPTGALGKFHVQKYLGIEPLGLQVKLGVTQSRYPAVQTASGTYLIPAEHASHYEDIRSWVMRSIERRDIKGAYPLPRRVGGGTSASLQQHLDAAQTGRPGPVGSLGAFYAQKYLKIEALRSQVTLGFTENGYSAVQTLNGTYRIPAQYATSDGEIKGWVIRSIERGDIKGAYPL